MSASPQESQCMSMSGKTSSNSDFKTPKTLLPHKPYAYSTPHGNFAHRLNIRFPWLKLILVLIIGVAIVLDILDITILKVNDPFLKIRIAPMSKHIHATERDFSKKLVALTFDDGPSSTVTPEILEILSEKDAVATFFMLGSRAKNNPDLVKQVEKAGHDIATHTMYHQNLIHIPLASAQSDINESKAVFKSILKHSPLYTRPPYGNTNKAILSSITNPVILWSVDTLDWRNQDPDSIINTAISEVHDGAIILMHDIYPNSKKALPKLIDTLRENGYEIVSVSELAKLRKVSLSPGRIYYNFRP